MTEHYANQLEAASALATQQGEEEFDLQGLPDIAPAEIPSLPSKAGSGTASLAMPSLGLAGQGCPKSAAPGARRLSFSGGPGLLPPSLHYARLHQACMHTHLLGVHTMPQRTSQHGAVGNPWGSGWGYGQLR